MLDKTVFYIIFPEKYLLTIEEVYSEELFKENSPFRGEVKAVVTGELHTVTSHGFLLERVEAEGRAAGTHPKPHPGQG